MPIQSDNPEFYGGVYRRNLLCLVGKVEAGSKPVKDGDGKDATLTRYSVHVLRIPVEPVSGAAIKASTDPAKGFLDSAFGGSIASIRSLDLFRLPRGRPDGLPPVPGANWIFKRSPVASSYWLGPHWKSNNPLAGIGAGNRLNREDSQERF